MYTKAPSQFAPKHLLAVLLALIVMVALFFLLPSRTASLVAVDANSHRAGQAPPAVPAVATVLQQPPAQQGKEVVREPVAAGVFYPADGNELGQLVDRLYSSVNSVEIGKVKALLVPHAGYQFSGQIAAAAFKQVEGHYDTVFVLGPSHLYPLKGISMLEATQFRTPLGDVKLSSKAGRMVDGNAIQYIPEAHRMEYSVENEVPFLQRRLQGFELVPMVVGESDPAQLADALLRELGENDLLVVSMDLSHYHPYAEAVRLDSFSVGRILALDEQGIFGAEVDAPWATSALLRVARAKGWKPVFLAYANSGDVTGDKNSVVGYSAIAFVEQGQQAASVAGVDALSVEDEKTLLILARATMQEFTRTGKRPAANTALMSPRLSEKEGCFVSMTKNGDLRGSIGSLLPQEELYNCVIDNAINAATNDNRFLPLTNTELKDVKITVSVLSLPQKLAFSSPQDLLSKLRPRVDGVILIDGGKSATYLPQVWDQIPDREDFLRNLCNKAGLAAECWKDGSTEVYLYQAKVFGE